MEDLHHYYLWEAVVRVESKERQDFQQEVHLSLKNGGFHYNHVWCSTG